MTMGGLRIRRPAVAGAFYPAEPAALKDALRSAFAAAVHPEGDRPVPKALVVPHAGYVYSGPVAASAYLRLAPARSRISRVVLVGPSHHVPVDGIAVTDADAFATPLGAIAVDDPARQVALALAAVHVDEGAHAYEHSLEVQLPFLQVVLEQFEVLPLAVGRCQASDAAEVLDGVWGGPETVVVVSSDLSHYQRYADAVTLDARTAAAIVAADPGAIGDRDACGAAGLRALLTTAAARELQIEQLDLRNSGDTAGDPERVVGYGAFAVG
jgi:MEMO1 family protein